MITGKLAFLILSALCTEVGTLGESEALPFWHMPPAQPSRIHSQLSRKTQNTFLLFVAQMVRMARLDHASDCSQEDY